jgi:hypothetical protein
MITKNHQALRSALQWTSTLAAASCLTLSAIAQSPDSNSTPANAPAVPPSDAGTPAMTPGQTNTANPIPDTSTQASAATTSTVSANTTISPPPAPGAYSADANAYPASVTAAANAANQTGVQAGPPDAIVPAAGGQFYNTTPVSTESIGMQQARFAHTSAVSTAAPYSSPTASTEVLDATSPVARPGMSPGQYGVAIALHEIAATNSPQKVLAADSIAPSFRNAPYESRTAFNVYALRIDAAASALDSLQAKAVQFNGDTQLPFRSAANNVRDRRADLDRCLTAAENATRDNWDQARSALADSYTRYADAVAQASAAASR